jgi:hypothetical protein
VLLHIIVPNVSVPERVAMADTTIVAATLARVTINSDAIIREAPATGGDTGASGSLLSVHTAFAVASKLL